MNKPKYIDTKNRRRKMGWEKNNNRPWKTTTCFSPMKSYLSLTSPLFYLIYATGTSKRDVLTYLQCQICRPTHHLILIEDFFILPSRPEPSIIMTTWVISASINLAQGQPNSVLFQPILCKRYIRLRIYIL